MQKSMPKTIKIRRFGHRHLEKQQNPMPQRYGPGGMDQGDGVPGSFCKGLNNRAVSLGIEPDN